MGKLKPSGVAFVGPFVVKTGSEHPNEAYVMRDPRVFAPAIHAGNIRIMLRGRPANPEDAPEAIHLLAKHVWNYPLMIQCTTWKHQLMRHLIKIYPSARLLDRVAVLRSYKTSVNIHGDATLANLIRVPILGLRWIDPMYRDYIPGDPLVDYGKLLQSGWNYEGALHGEPLRRIILICNAVENALQPGDLEEATTWLLVHIARLLRYHTPDITKKFRELMEDQYECTL